MKAHTGEAMAPDHPLGGIYAIMDRHGMLPDDIFCTRCAKPLNADGGHPAELYAGTYNGLCYGCTGAGPFVAAIDQLDGCRRVSWPPHSPSWRRSREDHYGYEGCETCGGLGIARPAYRGPDSGGGKSCPVCLDRWTNHPVRLAANRWTERAMRSCQAAFERAWDYHAGVPKKCAANRRLVLRAEFAGPDREHATPEFTELKGVYQAGYRRIRALITAHLTAAGWQVWTEPERDPDEFWLSYCRWRKMDPDTGLTYGYPDGFRHAHQPKPLCRQHRPWDGCKECHARYLDTLTLQQAEDGYHLGNVGQAALAAYRHLWATSAHRYSTIPWGWEDEPTDPEVIALVALVRRAAEERKAAS